MKKRLTAALLGIMMIAAMLPSAYAADLDGHWARTYIEYLDREGVINPSASTGNYEPDRDLTRAELMRYINRAFHFTETTSISYSDVQSNAWYYETIQIAVKYGYINGVGEDRMDPLGDVTREQAAVIIGRLFKDDPGNVAPADLTFTDKGQVSDWAAGYIKAAVDKGIISGYSDGTFRPRQVVTRGEVAKILYYYMGTSLSTAGRSYTGADLKTDTKNVTISESCTLSNAVVEGDLYITEGVGSDAVTLNNVTVMGTMIVSGGTVTMINTASDYVIVSSPMGRLLQVTATGASRINGVLVCSPAALHEEGDAWADGAGFSDVKIAADERASLTLDAAVDSLEIAGEATVSMTDAAQVYRMTIAQPASVTGYGTVYQADIRAGGVSFASSIALAGYTLADGVTATIGGKTVSDSSESGVRPASITIDRSDTAALDAGAGISVPVGTTVERVTCDGQTLAAQTDYTQTGSGIRLQAAYLRALAPGKHTVELTLSDGSRASVSLVITDQTGEEPAVQSLLFDRYYQSNGFRDVTVQVEGAATQTDISDVVLGLSRLDWTFDGAGRITLRRGKLAQLRPGSYTLTIDLQDGSTQSAMLQVQDSAPENIHAYVAEYNTFAPVEPSFAVPLNGRTVRSITAEKDGARQTLASGTDSYVSDHTVTLTQTGAERFRQGAGLVEFHATLSDDTEYILVIDYIAG